jgi:hypothetical protein
LTSIPAAVYFETCARHIVPESLTGPPVLHSQRGLDIGRVQSCVLRPTCVIQNIDPPPPSPPGECVPSADVGEDTLAGWRLERGAWGSIFWKTQDIGLASYSKNLSTFTSFALFQFLWQAFLGEEWVWGGPRISGYS